MKTLKKTKYFILILNLSAVVILCIFAIYACIYPIRFEKLFEDFAASGFFSLRRGLVFFVTMLVLALEVLFIWSLIQKEESIIETVSVLTPGGSITITILSLEAMAKTEIAEFDSLSDVRIKAFTKENNVSMDITMKVVPGVSIPEVTTKLQNAIKERIYSSFGIQLSSVRVFVDGIA